MSNVTVFGIPARQRDARGGTELCCAQRRYSFGALVAWLLAGGMMCTTQAFAKPMCKPALSIGNVQFTPMQPPTLERRWTATVSADASHCATTAGYFEIGFSRLKESGLELEFREQFIWSTPNVLVGVDFWADEAVETYWIDSIQACPCAK